MIQLFTLRSLRYVEPTYMPQVYAAGASQHVTTSWLCQSQLQFSYNYNSKNLLVYAIISIH